MTAPKILYRVWARSPTIQDDEAQRLTLLHYWEDRLRSGTKLHPERRVVLSSGEVFRAKNPLTGKVTWAMVTKQMWNPGDHKWWFGVKFKDDLIPSTFTETELAGLTHVTVYHQHYAQPYDSEGKIRRRWVDLRNKHFPGVTAEYVEGSYEAEYAWEQEEKANAPSIKHR